MALTKNEVAYLAAGCVTTQRVAEVAAAYVDWIEDQVTEATAILALTASMRLSKSPTVVMGEADSWYAALEADPPTITSITPNTGPAAGGTAFTVVGTNLTGATVLTFGGTTATSKVVVDDTHMTGVTPAKSAGAYNVVITTPAGTVTATNGFTYS